MAKIISKGSEAKNMHFEIRRDIPAYLSELKIWLNEVRDIELEAMDDFFTARVDEYEDHMACWGEAYERMAALIPEGCRRLLDLGCGTGLELDKIFARFPDMCVTGIDLCASMLEVLKKKHADKLPCVVRTILRQSLASASMTLRFRLKPCIIFVPQKKERFSETYMNP